MDICNFFYAPFTKKLLKARGTLIQELAFYVREITARLMNIQGQFSPEGHISHSDPLCPEIIIEIRGESQDLWPITVTLHAPYFTSFLERYAMLQATTVKNSQTTYSKFHLSYISMWPSATSIWCTNQIDKQIIISDRIRDSSCRVVRPQSCPVLWRRPMRRRECPSCLPGRGKALELELILTFPFRDKLAVEMKGL